MPVTPEPVSWWKARRDQILVASLIVPLLAVAYWTNAFGAADGADAGPEHVVTLDIPGQGTSLSLTPPKGWAIDSNSSPAVLVLRKGHAVMVVEFAGAVPDLTGLMTRSARQLGINSEPERVPRHRHSPFASGFSGFRATTAADGRREDLYVVGRDSEAVKVVALGNAGETPPVAKLIDSMTVHG